MIDTATIYTTGNTVTLTATYTRNGSAAAPDGTPTVKLFKSDQVTDAGGTIGIVAPGATGVYTCEITLPADTGTQTYYAEFTAASSGKAVVARVQIKAAFATST